MIKTSQILLGVSGVFALALASATLVGNPVTDPTVPEVGAPGGPSRPLDQTELDKWKRGRAIFDKPFHRSDGLGTPEMNADSCRACHQDPAIGGAGGLELNVSRFGSDNGGAGPFTNLPGGQGLSKLRPPYVEGREEYDDRAADVFEQRQTPSLFGAGLVDGISLAEIVSNADPLDLDGDGIRGTARMIDTGTGSPEVGRYGWKAQVPRLADFIKDAMGGECGITTPDDGRGFALVSDSDAVSDPELSPAQFDDVSFFLQNLAAPQRVGSTDSAVLIGETLFETVGCAKCHIPELQGENGPVPLYSDLLCHQIMSPTYRGMSEPNAGSGVFKTPPLWGAHATAPYMHDGRSETIGDAVRKHAGEAAGVIAAYQLLSTEEREAITLFVLDL